MKTSIAWMAVTAVALMSGARADEQMKTKPGTGAVHLNASDLKWTAGPPDLPKGMQISVMYGDPFKSGVYAMRLKMPDGYKVPPHWHTQDEQLTIMQGNLVLHMGDTMKSDPHMLDVGGYHFLPGKMHHSAEAKGETIVQLQGMGPFDIHYLNPSDNPNPKAASR